MLPAAVQAGTFADAPGVPDECPSQLLRRPSPWRDEVIGLARDYEHGNVPGWPDAYSARTVDGVRYVLAESQACASRLMEAR